MRYLFHATPPGAVEGASEACGHSKTYHTPASLVKQMNDVLQHLNMGILRYPLHKVQEITQTQAYNAGKE